MLSVRKYLKVCCLFICEANAFRMASCISSLTVKSCSCAYIKLLEAIFLCVDSAHNFSFGKGCYDVAGKPPHGTEKVNHKYCP
jgi:hypothetical protein